MNISPRLVRHPTLPEPDGSPALVVDDCSSTIISYATSDMPPQTPVDLATAMSSSRFQELFGPPPRFLARDRESRPAAQKVETFVECHLQRRFALNLRFGVGAGDYLNISDLPNGRAFELEHSTWATSLEESQESCSSNSRDSRWAAQRHQLLVLEYMIVEWLSADVQLRCFVGTRSEMAYHMSLGIKW